MAALPLLAAALLTACSPAPEPTPTPTAAFADEGEAFAAAEEVYRAYNDGLNARIADQSGPDPRDFLTGLALEADIETQNLFRENGIRLEGEAILASFTGRSLTLATPSATVVATVCIDARITRVIDTAGDDVTPADRADAMSFDVTFEWHGSHLLIAESQLVSEGPC